MRMILKHYGHSVRRDGYKPLSMGIYDECIKEGTVKTYIGRHKLQTSIRGQDNRRSMGKKNYRQKKTNTAMTQEAFTRSQTKLHLLHLPSIFIHIKKLYIIDNYRYIKSLNITLRYFIGIKDRVEISRIRIAPPKRINNILFIQDN